MSTMLYREGKGTQVWGKEYQIKVVKDEAIAEHIADGWHKHPSDVASKPVEDKTIRRTYRTKVNVAEKPQEEVSDESDNEG